jgi:SdpI/YfhL protein family/Tetratricopeptide repeat
MRRKTMARRYFSILLNSRLALVAFGVSALGLPFGLLPVSSAIAEQPAKPGPTSKDQRNAADYDEAIRLAPTDGSAYFARGRYWAEKREFGNALADLNEAIRLNPTDASAFAWRGRVWCVKENFDKAIADYNEAIRLDPQNLEHTEIRNEALQQKKVLQQMKALQQKEKPEPISWWTVFAFALLGFLFVGTGIPLILEKVAPNPWYGFRVQATLENPAVWYPANRYLGKCLLGFGLFVIVTAVGLSFVSDINPGVYFFSCGGALVVGSHVMLILCVLFLQSLSPPHVTRRNISAE